MRGSAIAASLALSILALSAAPVFAQTAPEQAKPAQTPPKPAQPPPAQPPAQPATPTPQVAAQPPAPFPQGAKVAYINPQLIFQQSTEGKAAIARVQALVQKKQTEGQTKAKQLQDNQTKLQSSGSVMNEAARAQLEKEIERQQIDLQRFQQDARAELDSLQQDVQAEFAKHLRLAIGEVATEKGIHIVFNVGEPAIAWASPALDVTADVVKKLDARPALPHD